MVEPGDEPAEPGRVAWRLYDQPAMDGDESAFAAELDRLFEIVGGDRVESIVVAGGGAANAARLLAAAAPRLPRLRSLFLGSIEPEHWEISWIEHGDVTAVLAAFPGLERLEVRGSDGLALHPVRHECLKVLRFESGGLPGAVVRAIGASDLPALEHLELWLGVEQYGGDHGVSDLEGILGGARLPALRRLGLRNSERQDEIAAAVATAPIVARLDALSLAMGTLTDEGAEALLSGQPLTHLSHLDLHYNFVSDELADRLVAALPGVAVDLSTRLPDRDDDRYVAVSE
ncbi:STM4015 family protein [Nonomuraea sp. NN258]|nr:STM4015 family protein [Nonomuraea antri]